MHTDAGALVASLAAEAAVIVSTRTDDHRTHIARGWGPSYDIATNRLDLVITAADDLGVVADLEANGAIAVTLVLPTTYEAVQLTGTVEWLGEPTDDDRVRVAAHLDGFVRQAMAIGLTDAIARLRGDRHVAVRIAVEHAYEQTPGPGAGRPL